jgi:hypothetical protein
LKRSVALALALAATPASAIAAPSLTSADATAYGTGQSYVRLFQDSLMPAICGIVLERARCLDDFHTVQGWRGSDRSDAAWSVWLAAGDLSLHPTQWNGASITDQTWAQNPAFAWWYTAGAVSIAAAQPQVSMTGDYLAHYLDDLAGHATSAPPGFAGLIPSNGTPFERAGPLMQALNTAASPAPYPAVAFEPGTSGTIKLGIYVGTLLQLIDNPLALSRPDSRAFTGLVLSELQRRHAQYADGLSVVALQKAVDADIPADPQRLDAAWRQPLVAGALNLKWPAAARNAFLLGGAVAQVAYNAAVLKDPNSDSTFRNAIRQLGAMPALSPAIRTELSVLGALPSPNSGGSWANINAAATRATLDLVAVP